MEERVCTKCRAILSQLKTFPGKVGFLESVTPSVKHAQRKDQSVYIRKREKAK